ncbi:hypothetical protein Bpfe_026347, partial [Biomphalaria pfeifferi]
VTSLKTTLRFEDHRLSYSAKSFDELLRLQLESQTFLKEVIVVPPFEFPLECFNQQLSHSFFWLRNVLLIFSVMDTC